MMEPQLEYVFELRVNIANDLHIGRGSDEQLSFTPITGGTISGPRLQGAVLPGGGDWAVTRSDTSELNARYLLQTDDGAVIDVLNRGYFRASPDVQARMEQGELVSEDEPGLYFRTAPVFQTDAPQHRWLAEHQFIGLARDDTDENGDPQVCVRVFLVR